jgi:thiol:disulfide interchange protein
MKKLARGALIISLSLSFAYVAPARSSATPALPDDVWLRDAAGHARAVQLQQELNVRLVVYFYADWCGYCRALDASYLPAAEVQDYLRRVVKVRINPEHGSAETRLAEQYGVHGYPAFFVVGRPSSQPVQVYPFRSTGNLTPAQFARSCREAARRPYHARPRA